MVSGKQCDQQNGWLEFVSDVCEIVMGFVILVESRFTVGNDCSCDWQKGSVNFAT